MAFRNGKRSAAPPPSSAPPVADPLQFAPLFLVFAALLLRLWGIGWALPNATRYFSYHPDESVVVSASLRVNPFLLLLDPGFYNYGSLSLLLNAAVIHTGELLGIIGAGPAPGIPSASALLAVRLLTAGLGAATCAFLYRTGTLLYGRTAGLVAAGLYAIAPLAVQHGHFATVDVPATFWISGSLFFAARYVSHDERRKNDLLCAGVWAGLAAATKYNAGLVLLAGGAAWWLAGRGPLRGEPVRLVLGALTGFLVGCPGVLLNFGAFRRDFAMEAFHVSKGGHGDVFAGTPSGFIYHVGYNLNWGLGWPLLLVALVSVGYALWRRRSGDWLLLAFAVPYYVLIGLAVVKFARYTLPLFPPLFLLVGAMVPPKEHKAAKFAGGAIAAAAGLALLFSLALDKTMMQTDTRDRAGAFIQAQNFPSVGFATGPWFFSPPLNPLLTAPVPATAKKFAEETQNRKLIPAIGEWNAAQISGSDAPQAVALSEFEYAPAVRVRNPDTLAYLSALETAYPTRTLFSQPVEVFGLRFTNTNAGGNSLPTQKMPHDMSYTNPTTVVFSR